MSSRHRSRSRSLGSLSSGGGSGRTRDFGSKPGVIDIETLTVDNEYYRHVIWTVNNLQLTLMSIDVGSDIGLEIHDDVDQFIRLEEGVAFVEMGSRRSKLTYTKIAKAGYAIIVPAGTWHNVSNIGQEPLKLYSIYGPPNHPHGIVEGHE